MSGGWEAEREQAAALLSEFIAIPSIALAAGEPAPDDRHGEARMAAAVIGFLAAAGIEAEVREIEPGRPQVTARVGSGRPDLLLTAHLDTVPPVGWAHDPFTARWNGSRVSGLGACDDKASLVAMLLALARTARAGGPPRGTLTFVGMVGEETFGVGSRALVGTGYRPDAAVVGEPTELRLVRVECGNVRWRIHALGRAAHGSRPWQGDSAIYRMADVLRFLRDEIAPDCRSRAHPLIGPAAFNVGLVEGGTAINIVPDRCTAALERRVLPGEDPIRVMEAINGRLAGLPGGEWLEFDAPLTVNHPLDTAEGEAVVRALAEALRARGRDPEPTGVSFGSDANRFAAVGVPCVVFGPGSIRVAHTCEEAVDLDELMEAVEVLTTIPKVFSELAVPAPRTFGGFDPSNKPSTDRAARSFDTWKE